MKLVSQTKKTDGQEKRHRAVFAEDLFSSPEMFIAEWKAREAARPWSS